MKYIYLIVALAVLTVAITPVSGISSKFELIEKYRAERFNFWVKAFQRASEIVAAEPVIDPTVLANQHASDPPLINKTQTELVQQYTNETQTELPPRSSLVDVYTYETHIGLPSKAELIEQYSQEGNYLKPSSPLTLPPVIDPVLVTQGTNNQYVTAAESYGSSSSSLSTTPTYAYSSLRNKPSTTTYYSTPGANYQTTYIDNGNTTVTSKSYTVTIMDNCLPESFVREALDTINPFFQYTIVSSGSAKYTTGKCSVNGDAEIVGTQQYNVLIAPGTFYHGHCRGKACVTIIIPSEFTSSPESLGAANLGKLIGHECGHDIETHSRLDQGAALDTVIEEYIAASATWSTTIVSVITG